MVERIQVTEVRPADVLLEADVSGKPTAHAARDDKIDWSAVATFVCHLIAAVHIVSRSDVDRQAARQQFHLAVIRQAFEELVLHEVVTEHLVQHLESQQGLPSAGCSFSCIASNESTRLFSVWTRCGRSSRCCRSPADKAAD